MKAPWALTIALAVLGMVMAGASCREAQATNTATDTPALHRGTVEIVAGDMPKLAPLTLDSAWVANDSLRLLVHYTGCALDTPRAITYGMYMKSMPPQLAIQVGRGPFTGNCRQMPQRTELRFALKAVRYGGRGPLILRVAGWPHGIRYDY